MIENASQLAAAIKAAKGGDTLTLAPGNYGALDLRDLSFSPPITIVSADPRDPAVFGVSNWRGVVAGIVLRDLSFRIADLAANHVTALTIYEGRDITIASCDFEGEARNDTYWGVALSVRQGKEITVKRNRARAFYKAFGFAKVDNLIVDYNDVETVGSDGFNLSEITNGRICANYVGGFKPAPADHPDGIQLQSNGATIPTSTLAVMDNCIDSRDGIAQGVFCRNEAAEVAGATQTMRYRDILISGNLGVGTCWNGIMVNDADGIDIFDNQMLHVPGGTAPTVTTPVTASWIRSDRCTGVVEGNSASSYNFGPGDATEHGQNTVVKSITQDRADALVAEWRTRFRTPPVAADPAPTPAPAPSPASDPRDAKIAELEATVAVQNDRIVELQAAMAEAKRRAVKADDEARSIKNAAARLVYAADKLIEIAG